MLDLYEIDSTKYGVCHSDELYMFWNPYFFESFNLNEVSEKMNGFRGQDIEVLINHFIQNDKSMSNKLTQAWVDFASTGI